MCKLFCFHTITKLNQIALFGIICFYNCSKPAPIQHSADFIVAGACIADTSLYLDFKPDILIDNNGSNSIYGGYIDVDFDARFDLRFVTSLTADASGIFRGSSYIVCTRPGVKIFIANQQETTIHYTTVQAIDHNDPQAPPYDTIFTSVTKSYTDSSDLPTTPYNVVYTTNIYPKIFSVGDKFGKNGDWLSDSILVSNVDKSITNTITNNNYYTESFDVLQSNIAKAGICFIGIQISDVDSLKRYGWVKFKITNDLFFHVYESCFNE